MYLPLLISPCAIKSSSSLLAPAQPGGPRKRSVRQLCVCRGKGKAVAVVVIPDEPAELLVPGCEAASAVSQAVCKAAASLTGRQLYEYIAACHSDVVSYQFIHA